MEQHDAALRALSVRLATEARLHEHILAAAGDCLRAHRSFRILQLEMQHPVQTHGSPALSNQHEAVATANASLALVSAPALIDAHDYFVHGALTALAQLFNYPPPGAGAVAAREARAKLQRHGAPFAEVHWNPLQKRYDWPQLEAFVAASKAADCVGLRARTLERFTLPYLGALQHERVPEDRYIMEINADYRCLTDARFVNADPAIYSALVPLARGDTRATRSDPHGGLIGARDTHVRVGLFGLAIAGLVNEPAAGEQINLVPCSSGFSAAHADGTEDAREIPFHIDILTPLGYTVHLPAHTMFMSLVGERRAQEYDPRTELLTVYSLADFRAGAVDEHSGGLNEDTNRIVRSQPLPRYDPHLRVATIKA